MPGHANFPELSQVKDKSAYGVDPSPSVGAVLATWREARKRKLSITSNPVLLEFFDMVLSNFRLDTCPVGPRKKKNLEELQKSKREQIRI